MKARKLNVTLGSLILKSKLIDTKRKWIQVWRDSHYQNTNTNDHLHQTKVSVSLLTLLTKRLNRRILYH